MTRADAMAEPDDAAMQVACTLEGTYASMLMPVAGNCGPLAESFRVDVGPSAARTTQEMRLDSMITTEIVVKGCSIALTREVSRGGVVEQRIHAGNLEHQPGGALTGEAVFTRFDASTVLCEGTYELRLTPTSFVGGTP